MMVGTRRRLTHSDNISFRINPGLRCRVEQAATEQGMSVAEFTRAALRSELGRVAA